MDQATDGATDGAGACQACATALAGRYCHACGQDTLARPRPLREWAEEAFSETNLVDGRTARTLAALAIRPGRLLEAYRSGAGSLYQTPTKLFVVMTALFLLTLGWTDVLLYQHVAKVEDPTLPVAASANPDGVTVDFQNATQGAIWMRRRVDPALDPAVIAAVREAGARATNARDRNNLLYDIQANREQAVVSQRLAAWLPNALWLLMPLYAVLLMPLFGRRRLFMEHVVFAMWAHVMGFGLLSLVAVANRLGATVEAWAMAAPYLVYFTLAARRYYGLGWFQAAWRGGLHLLLYAFLVLAPAAIAVSASAVDWNAFWAYVSA
jgi:hypothetical protein